MKVHLFLVPLTLLFVACGEVKTGESVSSNSSGSDSSAQAVGGSKTSTRHQGGSDSVAVGSISQGESAAVNTEGEVTVSEEEEVDPECALGGTCHAKKPPPKATPLPSKCALGGC
jgi:hypothetical protein